MGTPYEADVVAWAVEQAALLRCGRLNDLDLLNLAEEIDGVARHERRELKSRLAVLLAHLLKWKYQPYRRSNSWRLTIHGQRSDIADELEGVPSLRHLLENEDWLQKTWIKAVGVAAAETAIDEFPAEPIWSMSQILDDKFFPE
jgi:hypothetical protein